MARQTALALRSFLYVSLIVEILLVISALPLLVISGNRTEDTTSEGDDSAAERRLSGLAYAGTGLMIMAFLWAAMTCVYYWDHARRQPSAALIASDVNLEENTVYNVTLSFRGFNMGDHLKKLLSKEGQRWSPRQSPLLLQAIRNNEHKFAHSPHADANETHFSTQDVSLISPSFDMVFSPREESICTWQNTALSPSPERNGCSETLEAPIMPHMNLPARPLPAFVKTMFYRGSAPRFRQVRKEDDFYREGGGPELEMHLPPTCTP